MPFDIRKMPIVAERNDTQSTPSDPFHPDGGLFCQLYNSLIDDLNALELTIPTNTDDLAEGSNLFFTDTRSRNSISVVGNGTYDPLTGIITISNANLSVDSSSLTSTVGLVDTYTLWADPGQTIAIGQFTVTNGDSAGDANQLRLIEQVSPPASIADRIQIYASDTNTLRYIDEDDNDKLISDTCLVNAYQVAMAT